MQEKEVAIVKSEVSKVASAATALVIKDKVGMENATSILASIKRAAALVKEKKEAITKPLNEALKGARDLFRPFEAASEEAEGIVKQKMVEYSDKVEKENAEKQAALAKKVETGAMKPETAAKKLDALENVSEVSTATGAAEFRIVKEVVIDNPSLIPERYHVIDDVLVRRDALAGIAIAGVRVVEKKIVASYSKRTEDKMGGLGMKK